jgi:tetratricopeptide (TPR) repeat protein
VDPSFVNALSNLGICLTRQERYEEAIAIYQQGLLVEAKSGTLISNLARTHQLLGNLEEATLLLDRLEDIEHASPFFYIYRGEQALDQGQLSEALDYMREAYRRSHEIPEVHVGLAKVYLALGELDQTQHYIERALRLDATHEGARRFAEMLALGGRKENP